MNTYYVTRIEEPDFGCEGRPEGQEIKDKVPSLASPVLFTDLPDCLEVHILKRGKIRSGEPFLELHNKEKQEVG